MRWLDPLRRKRRPKVGLLACVYTCAAHAPLLARFQGSPVGVLLRQRADTRVLVVDADPALDGYSLDGDRLRVGAEERYDLLSLKTQRMVAACVDAFAFDRLLKIDVTTVLDALDGPEYAGRVPLDQAALANFVRDADPSAQYTGFIRHAAAGREGAEGWAAKKGGAVDYARLFGERPMPPFYSGKCYILGRAFAEYVAREGTGVADEQARYFMGSEDVMIGRLYQRFAELPA